MIIKLIEFHGYKSYNGSDTDIQFQVLKLAPLTIIFGKNNSGKSAAVRLPKLLLGGLECNDDRILPLNVRGLSYGNSFLDIIHGGAFFGRPAFRILAEHENASLDITATLFIQSALTSDEPPRIWSYEMREPETISIAGPEINKDRIVNFKGLLPSEPRWDGYRKAAGIILDGMIHLGPIRARVHSAYANEPFPDFGLDGAGTPYLLRLDSTLADAVGAWYANNMEGWRLALQKDSASFNLNLSRGGIQSVNLAHSGEGLQQILPVVTHQLWRQQQRTGPFLDIIEQPELHLHAAAQAPLADLFIDTALQYQGQTLVETNSKAILLRLQRRVAEGKIAPNLIALYFVEMTDSGSQLQPVGIDSTGDIEWWPPGVFEEDFNEVAAIRRAQRKQGNSEAQP